MERNDEPRLAVLIDADNTAAKWADAIFEEIATLGEASVRRIYGDFSEPHLRSWEKKLAGLLPSSKRFPPLYRFRCLTRFHRQGCISFVEELAHALAAEFQKIRNMIYAAHGRAPPKVIESPARILAGLYRQGRWHDAADIAVELQRPSLNEAPQSRREARGHRESARHMDRVRRAREQAV